MLTFRHAMSDRGRNHDPGCGDDEWFDRSRDHGVACDGCAWSNDRNSAPGHSVRVRPSDRRARRGS